jgi:spore coat protein A
MPNLNPFQDCLPIPDVVMPIGSNKNGHLTMKAKVKKIKLHKNLPATKVWSYHLAKGKIIKHGDGSSYLGPTIQVSRGDLVHVNWQNKIDSCDTLPYEVIKVPFTEGDTPIPQNIPGKANALPDTGAMNTFDKMRAPLRELRSALVTHLHGGRSQADSDGWPDDTAISGQTEHYTYQNDQSATMLWYHDHANHITRLNVFAGLAGVWLIRDEEEESLNLPDGDFELPLVIQDRNLDLDNADNFTGALLHKTEVTEGPAEFFGPYTLVNGKIWPKASVEPRLYRFRVLNGSNARTYRLMLLDELGNSLDARIWQIGCDQGMTENKISFPTDGLVLMPGERVDLLVDFSEYSNQKLYLWNSAEAPFSNAPITISPAGELASFLLNPTGISGSEDDRRPYPQIMRFDVEASASSSSHLVPPDPLWQVSRPPVGFAANMPIRLMALVEKPADPTVIDSTAMLVFWEYVEDTPKTPAPPGADIVRFSHIHPATDLLVPPKRYWKGAEEFYDRINWEVHLDDTEQWYIVNISPDTHPVHVHQVDMNVNQRYAIAIQPVPILLPSAQHYLSTLIKPALKIQYGLIPVK